MEEITHCRKNPIIDVLAFTLCKEETEDEILAFTLCEKETVDDGAIPALGRTQKNVVESTTSS